MSKRQFATHRLSAGPDAFGHLSLQAGVTLRLLLCSPFIESGFSKLLDFDGATAEVRELVNFEPAGMLAALTIIVQLAGSISLMAGGRLAMGGALVLSGFTLAATLLAHAFWLTTGPMLAAETNIFFEHLGLIAGLLLAGFFAPIRREA